MKTAIIALCLLAGLQLRADMKLKNYKHIMTSSDAAQIDLVKMFVGGLGDGISTTNTLTGNHLFCPPEHLGLVLANYTDILDKQVARIDNDDAKLQDIPIGMLLIKGLAETFPCPKATQMPKK
jgi:hypothetical protein